MHFYNFWKRVIPELNMEGEKGVCFLELFIYRVLVKERKKVTKLWSVDQMLRSKRIFQNGSLILTDMALCIKKLGHSFFFF